ncbi:hypothetical protein JVU11DRAFT_10903 [Chiua virens]|nr:hypothetical protein JVU11DRAFT_10903 [Chiua virens]
MATPKLLGNKRALLVAVRRVRCRPRSGTSFSDLPDLDSSHRDAKAFRDYLITFRGYEAEDVIVMADSKVLPKHLWPTRKNILYQIKQLTSEVPEDCRICFYFVGRGLEEEDIGRAGTRADGRNSKIVSADGKPILDNVLHDRLITPLEGVKGSELFALFDCCHSETFPNLRRGDESTSKAQGCDPQPPTGPCLLISETKEVGELKVTKPDATWTELRDSLTWVFP